MNRNNNNKETRVAKGIRDLDGAYSGLCVFGSHPVSPASSLFIFSSLCCCCCCDWLFDLFVFPLFPSPRHNLRQTAIRLNQTPGQTERENRRKIKRTREYAATPLIANVVEGDRVVMSAAPRDYLRVPLWFRRTAPEATPHTRRVSTVR